MKGRVNKFIQNKGFGFIKDEEGNERFFHESRILDRSIIKQGYIVEFHPSETKKGLEATNIRIISRTPAPEISAPQRAALISEITNWNIEAKLEDNERYFYQPDGIDKLENGTKCYVIGRKGTGKTAISEYIAKSGKGDGYAEKLSFKNFPFNDLYNLHDKSFTYPNQYITIWKYIIYSTVAKMMATNDAIEPSVQRALKKAYDGNNLNRLAKTLSEWTGKNIRAEFLGFEIEISGDPNTNNDWPSQVEALETIFEEHLDDANYYVVFDELDEDYKCAREPGENDKYWALLTSLFKAVQDVKSIFRGKNIKPIIFVRDDIFSQIRDSDKTKWIDMSVWLSWNSSRIKSMLAYRLCRALGENHEIWDFDQIWELIIKDKKAVIDGKNIDSFHYIASNTCYRPRDFVHFLKLASDIATEHKKSIINGKMIESVSGRYSNYFKSELEDEIHGKFPDICELFDLISHQRKRRFSSGEFHAEYTALVDKGKISETDPEYTLRLLFEFSVIGNQTDKGRNIFRFAHKESSLNFGDTIIVHPGLYKSLQL